MNRVVIEDLFPQLFADSAAELITLAIFTTLWYAADQC